MTREVVGSMSDWSGLLKDFFRQINDGSITSQMLKAFNEHRNPFVPGILSGMLADWQTFYRDVFDIEADFSNLVIPQKRKGFDRLIIVAQGMTPQRLYDKCRELFPCRKRTNEDLDKIVKSDRTAQNGAYAIWIRERVEADEELKNLSANDLKKRNIFGITLEERLIYELEYFRETQKHLDIENITLCTGSRCGGGGVPHVSWLADDLYVNWYDLGYAFVSLRSRQAVS